MPIPRTLVVGALGALALGTVATSANAGYGGDDSDDRYGDGVRAVSYINGDGGTNADVDPNSSCYRPDQYDMQAFSSAASGNPGERNVHNDACFLDGDGNKVGKGVGASFVSSGTGYISACPDPDGAGPEFARLRDLNGDGRNDSCFQSSYQEKATAGDFEYHVRVNNTGTRGEQQVKWGRDNDRDGRIDSRNDDDIKVDWSSDGRSGSDRNNW